MTSEKQANAVNFIDDMLDIKYDDDLSDQKKVSEYIGKYLRKAQTCRICGRKYNSSCPYGQVPLDCTRYVDEKTLKEYKKSYKKHGYWMF